MNVYEYENPEAFLKMVEPVLLQNEVVNDLPLGILYSLAGNSAWEGNWEDQPFMAYVGDDHKVKLILLMTPPHHLIVCGVVDALNQTIGLATNYLISRKISFPGVIGSQPLAEAFVKTYQEATRKNASIQMNQRIYKLESVKPIKTSSGLLRTATEKEIDLISRWIQDFDAEALEGEMSDEEAYKRAVKGIDRSEIFVWDDGEPVAMAKRSRPTKSGIVVTLVYTPPKFRGIGYASNCVATLSQKLLDEGFAYCSLYTDLSNPTSNSIYQKIGYEPIADSIVYTII
ncbi:GNAT family N-acetyltransferase [Camelliibacillus cellulosilyticus]|uniref:GNAT family N-acetyltransferase n=1 Tax=Camelliibacillus cellulosilyticus TaxID=2174486 RepID=A0ABV9GKE7_9BACL